MSSGFERAYGVEGEGREYRTFGYLGLHAEASLKACISWRLPPWDAPLGYLL